MSYLYNSLSYTKHPCLNIKLHFGKYKTSFLIQNFIVNIIFRCKYKNSMKYETLLLIYGYKISSQIEYFVANIELLYHTNYTTIFMSEAKFFSAFYGAL